MPSLSRRSLLLGGIAVPALHPAFAAAELAPSLQQRIAERMAAARIPGLALTAILDGNTKIARGYGVASPAFDVAASDRTLFHLGSVGKHFTAALVLRLAEAGTIALDKPVGTYLRDVPAQFADRSLQSMLTHTSGIPDYESLPGFEEDRPNDRASFLQKIGTLQPSFAEGEAWDYSNTAYVLLGYLLADAKGRSYRAQVDEDLLRPLGMQEARVDDATAIIAQRAEPFALQDGVLRRARQMDGDYSGWADGGVIMSARDAVRWEAGLREHRTTSARGDAAMHTPALLRSGRSVAYGAAWFLDRWRGQDVQYHSGAMPGFLAFYLRTARVSVIAAINLASDEAGAALRSIVLETAESLQPDSTPLSLPPIRDDMPALTASFRTMLHRGGTQLDPDRFAPEIAVLLKRDAGRQPFPNRGGEPVAFELVERLDEPGGTVRRYRARYAARADHYTVGYAPDGRIYRVRGL
jgi:CubicO group peptidase (beta-lactamase class C family)